MGGGSQAVVMFQQHPTPKGRGGLLWLWVNGCPSVEEEQQSDRSLPFGDQASPGGGPRDARTGGRVSQPPWATLIVYSGGQSPLGASSCFYPQTAILQSNILGMPLH